MEIRRGDIFYADLGVGIGSEQEGIRPMVVIQNNIGNRHSPTIICAAITSKISKARLPTHVLIQAKTCGLREDSVIMLEQIRTINKTRILEKIGCLDYVLLRKIDEALLISLQI